jgi:endonuclease/exonuclease/phosphatase (EEP) superfamily protein YafD
MVLMVPIICSWMGMFGGWHWFLDLFSHFRWQYLLASVVAVAWAAWRRQRKVMLLAVITLVLNAGLIGQLAWHPRISREAVSDDFRLRVLSLNVLTSNTHKQAVLDHVLASDADVVFLMEVNQGWMSALSALKAKYPHVLARPRQDNFGVALFSRIPWTGEDVPWLGEADVPSLEVHLSHQAHELVLLGTHPVPPVGGDYAALRNEQLRLLAEHVAKLGGAVLVVGDLNSSPWSEGMRIVTRNGGLGFRSIAPPWTPTWRAGTPLAIPIDHALCTAPLVIVERSVGGDVGSDHRSLNITVGREK